MIALRKDFDQRFSQDIHDMFGEGSALSSAKSFEYRPEQQQMGAAVASALEETHHLVVEAGTGVGKSLAINANIATLVAEQFPSLAAQFQSASAPNAFTVHGDDAPTFYLVKKGLGGGQLGQADPLTRDFERQVANLKCITSPSATT